MKKVLSLLTITILMASIVLISTTKVNAKTSNVPKKQTITSIVNSSKRAAKMTWEKDSKATGYQIYMANRVVDEIHMKTTVNDLALRENPTTKSKKLASIPKGTKLYTGLSDPKKADGYTWYYVFYSTSDGYMEGYVAGEYLTKTYTIDKYTKVKTISNNSKTSYTKSKLTKGNTYYFRVRGYKKVDGKIYYGNFSKAKSIKIVK